MASTGKFVYMAHHLILLRLNPFSFRDDRFGWMFQHSVSELRVCLSAEGAKNVSWTWLSLLWGWGRLTMASTDIFVYMAHHFILLRVKPFSLRDGWLFEHSSHSSAFPCQQRVPKTFPGPGYLCSENVLVWLWHPPVNLYIWLTISYCYDSIPLALGLIDWDGCIRTLCQSCGFACQQKVLKFFSGTGCLCSADGVVCLWHPLATGQSL